VNGWTFSSATEGGMITASSLLPTDHPQYGFGLDAFQYTAAQQPIPNLPIAVVYGAVYDLLAGIPDDQIVTLLAERGINLSAAAVRLLKDNFSPDKVQVQGFADTELDIAPLDVEPLKSTITQTFEVGYHGLMGRKFHFAVDGYYTKKSNFVSGITRLTPLAVYSNFEGDFTPAVSAAFDANPAIVLLLQGAGLTSDQVAGVLTVLAQQQGLEELGVAVVQPDQNTIPGGSVYAYRNFGQVDIFGVDLSMQVMASERLTLFGNLSYISDDFFDSSELGEADSSLFLTLNAPKLKAKGGFNLDLQNGVSVNASGRFTQAFPVASGPYIGGLPIQHPDDIGGLEDYFLLDVGAGYDLKAFARGMRVDFIVQNILNEEHREFIGAPRIGRLALVRISYSR
jgi:iron complex outermembrane receptor protein